VLCPGHLGVLHDFVISRRFFLNTFFKICFLLLFDVEFFQA
jgi:hypothetical protein